MDAVTATGTTQSVQPQSAAEPKTRTVTSDFETFLKLLTTQLQNQDPLKPLDSTEFVAQLASFSAVEQQVQTNDVLAQIQSLLSGPSTAGLSSWIGTDVRAVRDIQFDGVPLDVFVEPATGAERADLVVLNPSGEVVQRSSIGLQSDLMEWAGVQDDGTPLASGTYQLVVESYQGSNLIGSEPAQVYSRVVEAQIDDDAISLVLADGSVIPADQVTAIRGSAPDT